MDFSFSFSIHFAMEEFSLFCINCHNAIYSIHPVVVVFFLFSYCVFIQNLVLSLHNFEYGNVELVGWLLIYSLKRKFLRCLAVVVKRGIRNNKNYKALPFMHYFEDPPQIWIFKVQAVRHWLFSVHNIFEYGNICRIGWLQDVLKARFYKLCLSLSFGIFYSIKVVRYFTYLLLHLNHTIKNVTI